MILRKARGKLARLAMSITEIASILGVGKSWLYGVIRNYPNEAPESKSRESLEHWAAFVAKHRLEPTGDDRVWPER